LWPDEPAALQALCHQAQRKRLLGAVLRVTSPCAMMELLGHLS
jgi:hypothetical protein